MKDKAFAPDISFFGHGHQPFSLREAGWIDGFLVRVAYSLSQPARLLPTLWVGILLGVRLGSGWSKQETLARQRVVGH